MEQETLDQINKYAAIVGSRSAPIWALELMIRAGRTLCDLGYAFSSGDAYGSDRAGWYGAKQSKKWNDLPNRIYIIRNGFLGRYVYDNPFFYDYEQFKDTIPQAQAMAANARGGFGGLSRSGIALHTRNVFQVYGDSLDKPIQFFLCYAEAKSKTSRLSGGTNTAFQLAKELNLEYFFNLYWGEDVNELEAWLNLYESDEPYEKIDWREILDPVDPRLPELMAEY